MPNETAPPPKRKRGRPPGTPGKTKYGVPSIIKSHRMTPRAHEWVKNNREWIEEQARE